MKDFYTADPLSVGPAELARTYPSQGFQPTAWFSLVFGVLPHREMYQLASAKARQELLDELARIDKALLRKGRLIASHEFGPLSVPKAQALATALGQQSPITEPITLADLFNREDPTFLSEPKTNARIGFGRPS